jgi:hypothetical protein
MGMEYHCCRRKLDGFGCWISQGESGLVGRGRGQAMANGIPDVLVGNLGRLGRPALARHQAFVLCDEADLRLKASAVPSIRTGFSHDTWRVSPGCNLGAELLICLQYAYNAKRMQPGAYPTVG